MKVIKFRPKVSQRVYCKENIIQHKKKNSFENKLGKQLVKIKFKLTDYSINVWPTLLLLLKSIREKFDYLKR